MNEINLTGQFDSKLWAIEFVKIVKQRPEIATDMDTMHGWFANAIMAGYDQAKREEKATLLESLEKGV